ncbi:unnamed protein product, partial [Lymnaea stagnalis]
HLVAPGGTAPVGQDRSLVSWRRPRFKYSNCSRHSFSLKPSAPYPSCVRDALVCATIFTLVHTQKNAMFILLITALATLLAFGSCNKNYTITSEVVFDIEVKNYNGNGDDISGKVVVGLFGETAPVASLNFKTLCEGYKRPNQAKISYRNTYCHRVVKDMLIQCGDVFGLDGRGSTSIYGEYFNDENFVISHTSGGLVSMANKGRDTNGSQFFFTLGSSRFFDKKHVAFGKVVKGFVSIS